MKKRSLKKLAKSFAKKSNAAVSIQTTLADGKTVTTSYDTDHSWDRKSKLTLPLSITKTMFPKTYDSLMDEVIDMQDVTVFQEKFQDYFKALSHPGTFEAKSETITIKDFISELQLKIGDDKKANITQFFVLFTPDAEEKAIRLNFSGENLHSTEDFKQAIQQFLLVNLRNHLVYKESTEKVAKQLQLI